MAFSKRARACGHLTQNSGFAVALNEVYYINLPRSHGRTDYCLACYAAMFIHCAWCGETIWPMEPITLYEASEERPLINANAALGYIGANHYVGCNGWQCVEDISDLVAQWQANPDSHTGQVVLMPGGAVPTITERLARVCPA